MPDLPTDPPVPPTQVPPEPRSATVVVPMPTRATPGPVVDAATPAEILQELGLDRPATLGRYRVLKELGRGGMGVVYLAEDPQLPRQVAVKVLLDADLRGPTARRRFRTEAEALARVQHPNIVQIYEVGDQAGRPFLALEYVPGGNLAQHLGGRPQPPRDAAALLAQLADALEAAHRAGVVHRDLKPANVLLAKPNPPGPPSLRGKGGDQFENVVVSSATSPSGSPPFPLREGGPGGLGSFTPKITDFGLAKTHAADGPPTASGDALGTPQYMAPEQAVGASKDAGPPADIYALGVILYEMLTGRPPLLGVKPLETALLVMITEPVPPRRLQPDVPHDLETICLKCLEKAPGRRYPSAQALAEDLRRFLDGRPILARPTPAWERALKWARRRPAAAGLIATSAAAVVTLVVAVGLLWQANAELRAAREQEEQARREVDANFRLARKAVDDLFVTVTEAAPLKPEALGPIRQLLLEKALPFYDQFRLRHGDDPGLAAEVARDHFRVGVIATEIGDKVKARAAFARSAELWGQLAAADPQARAQRAAALRNLAVLVSHTGQPAEAVGVLEVARALYARLIAEEPSVADHRAGLAGVWINLGPVRRTLGQPQGALEAYEQARDLYLQLIAAVPQDPEHQASLAMTLANLGVLHRSVGQVCRARLVLNQARALWARLVLDHPTVSLYRSELARTWNNLANLAQNAGDPQGAAAAFEQARQVHARLAAEYPGSARYQADLAYALNNLSAVHRDTGRLAEGLEALAQAQAVWERLAAAYPAVPEYRAEQASVAANRGALENDAGRPAAALPLVELAGGLLSRLVADHPDQPAYQATLVHARNVQGLALQALGRQGEALKAFRQAREVAIPLIAAHPAPPAYRQDLARVEIHLGLQYQARRDLEAARKAFEAARGLLERLAADHPAVPEYRADLAATWLNLGLLRRADRQPREALEAYDQARTLLSQLAADFPTVTRYRATLAAVANNRGNLQAAELGDRSAALRSYQECLQLRERLVADHPDAAEHRADLAALLTNLGPMLGEMGRAEEGMAHLRRAYDLRAKLAADQPAVTAYRTGLGNTAYQIGHQLQARVPAEALPWFDKAVAALGPVVKQDATQTLARNALRQASWERAEALGKLNRYAEAVADWRRAGDLSTPTDRAQFHLQAVYFQARGGDPAGATAAAEPLAADPAAAATTWYVLARVYALAAGAQEDAAARERHAARAVALLNRARAAGAFRKRAEVEQVKVLTDLEPLRQRDDFKQFLAGLEPARD